MQLFLRILLVLIILVCCYTLFQLVTGSFQQHVLEPGLKQAYWGHGLIGGFAIIVVIGEFLMNGKTGSSSYGIQFGYGSGFYLCCISFLSVVVYYRWFLKNYVVQIKRPDEEIPKEELQV
jgi:hypothetical protein